MTTTLTSSTEIAHGLTLEDFIPNRDERELLIRWAGIKRASMATVEALVMARDSGMLAAVYASANFTSIVNITDVARRLGVA